jgi:hypothetical protein
MHQRPLIKRTVSLLLLLIFAFSITPKQWIHELVFKHKDVYTNCTDNYTRAHLHQSGFHCELDNILVLSPFISDISTIDPQAPLVHSDYYSHNIISLHSADYFYSDLRGPPAIS